VKLKNVILGSITKRAGTEFLVLLNYVECLSGLLTSIVGYPRSKEVQKILEKYIMYGDALRNELLLLFSCSQYAFKK
jgi:hypothetical protein